MHDKGRAIELALSVFAQKDLTLLPALFCNEWVQKKVKYPKNFRKNEKSENLKTFGT